MKPKEIAIAIGLAKEGKPLSGIAVSNYTLPRAYANSYFGGVYAHQLVLSKIDIKKFLEELDPKEFSCLHLNCDLQHPSFVEYFNEDKEENEKRGISVVDEIVLVKKTENILFVNTDGVVTLYCLQARVADMHDWGIFLAEKYGEKKEEPDFGEIFVLTKGATGRYEMEELEITNPEITVEESYPEYIVKDHANTLEILSKEEDAKGIILMHGEPGTGKTTYIRHLIAAIKKRFIFVPPDTAASFGDPEITKVLLNWSNCILIIEDGEKVLKSREKGLPSPISALLNLSDGLISDALHIQILATFNCSLEEIDPAILRKGRLLKRITFTKIGIEQANEIRKKIGKKPLGGSKTATFTAAEIYND